MVVKALDNHHFSCVSQAKKVWYKMFGRQKLKVSTWATSEFELSVDHIYISGHPVETSERWHATFGFCSAPATG